jgi:PadR family transcriptional regulator
MGKDEDMSHPPKPTLLQGSLDMLILRTVSAGPKHGYAIAKHLRDISDALLNVEEGSLYPALHRMERRGWIEGRWGSSEANRRARYYRLTPKGRKQLESETAAWIAMSRAIERVLNHLPAEA